MSIKYVNKGESNIEKYYFKDDPELIEVLDPYLGNK